MRRGAPITSYSRILDGTADFSFNLPLTFGLISKTEYSYYPSVTEINSKKYTLLLDQQTMTDYLTNLITTKKYETYSTDGYNLPKIVVSKNFLGATLQSTLTTTTNYVNNFGSGANYYIGRPTDVTETAVAYGDTKSTYHSFTYTNGNITTTRKRVGTTAASASTSAEIIIETMDYDPSGNGNLISKSLSAAGFPVSALKPTLAARTTSFTYDATNRFIKTSTDVDGNVVTNNTYHPLYGLVQSQTNNTLEQTTNNFYDNWGKCTMVTDFLGKSNVYSYTKVNNTYTTTQIGDDGSSSIVESDALARVIRKGFKNINSLWSYTLTDYDALGRKSRESFPIFTNGSPIWTLFEYDDYSKPIRTIEPDSKITTISYNGLTTNINDGRLIKSSTTNANGHTISTNEVAVAGTLSGGSITNTFNALGNVLISNYDGVATTMIYDLWGRKTQLTDPSAGIYVYEYNAFGEIVQESNPNGKTDTFYTSTGKISSKRVYDLASPTPVNTNMTTVYNYDSTYKWLNSMVVTNPFDGNSIFAYSYDIGTTNGNTNTKQLRKSIETITPQGGTGDIVFTKELNFDSFGRVAVEKNTASSHGQSSIKTTNNTYINGKIYQIFDGLSPTGTPLWQANSVNEKGQINNVMLGNGIAKTTSSFDVYGHPLAQNDFKTGTTPINILKIDNLFDIYKDLTSRNIDYNTFGTNEYFEYDALDRFSGTCKEEYELNTFDVGLHGFANTNQSNISNTDGKIRVQAQANLASIEKKLGSNLAVGKFFNISFESNTFELNTGCNTNAPFSCNNGVLRVKLYEKNPINNVISNIVDQVVTYGQYTIQLTTINSNTDVYMQFYMTVINLNSYPNLRYYIDNMRFNTSNNCGDFPIYQTYDNRGKILSNELGVYNYTKPAKPYHNTSVTLSEEGKVYYASRSTQTINYNAFQSPTIVSESGREIISFGYNVMQQRMVMYYGNTNTNKLLRPFRKYYSADGSMEIKYTMPITVAPATPAKVEFYTYVGGDAYNAPIVSRKIDGATPENFYLHRDYLGSILVITNSIGTVIEKRQFDAWGNITRVEDGVGTALTRLSFIDRGYTSHEHLQGVALINMNARLYDPKLRRLLGPDNFVTNPSSTQDYNRYAYARNNPLKYVDPSGNNPLILIGVGLAVVSYFVGVHMNHQKVTVGGVLNTIFWSFMSSAVSFGVGEITCTINNLLVKSLISSLAHGTTQGGLTAIQGGKFWNSMSAGSLSSLAASGFGAIPSIGSSTVGTLAFGAIAGGAGASLTGGNFWQGAVTGLVVSGLNHALHDSPNKRLIRKLNREIDKTFGARADREYGLSYDGGATDADVDKALNIDTIKTIRGNSGNPAVVNMNADNDADGTYKSVIEDTQGGVLAAAQPGQAGTIRLYGGAFSSPRHLVHTILHELGHAYSRYTGNFLSAYNSRGWSGAVALDEVFAYTWGSCFGQTMFVAPGVPQKGLGKALGVLGL